MYWHYDHRSVRITNYELQIMNYGQAFPVPISGQGTPCPTGAKDDGEGLKRYKKYKQIRSLKVSARIPLQSPVGSEEPPGDSSPPGEAICAAAREQRILILDP